jgi:hypothetical protein
MTKLKKYEDGTRDIPLDDIVQDGTLQVREKLDWGMVQRYAMTAAEEFPAVELADIDGMLFLVDGWHRVAATRAREEGHIRAKVEVMTREQAMGKAAVANLRHGLPLKNAERLPVFKAYVQSGMNKDGKQLKSYRVIAKELPGIASTATLQRWMSKHFPRIARAMRGEGDNKKGDGIPPPLDCDPEHFRQAEQSLVDALNLYTALKGDDNEDLRAKLVHKAEVMLMNMKSLPYTVPEF